MGGRGYLFQSCGEQHYPVRGAVSPGDSSSKPWVRRAGAMEPGAQAGSQCPRCVSRPVPSRSAQERGSLTGQALVWLGAAGKVVL